MADYKPSRRTVLKGIGTVGVVGTITTTVSIHTLTGEAEGVPGTKDSQARVWTTKQAKATDGATNNPIEGNVMMGLGDALQHVNAYEYNNSTGDVDVDIPDGITSIGELYTFFRDFLKNDRDKSLVSPHSNLLVVREDRFGDHFDAEFFAEYKGNVAVTLGAEAIAHDLPAFMPTRYGSDQGQYWLQRAVQAAGVNYGVVDGHGMVYTDSSVGSGQISTPAAPMDDDTNICGTSSNVLSEADIYDTYFWDGCAGSQIRDYFGV